MPDLRYHVVSLISVFLALAVGVLLGIGMADNGLLDEQLRAQVSDIRADLEGQRSRLDEKDERIAVLEERAAGDDAMLAGISEAVISGRLEGTNVALVLGPYAEESTAEAVQDALALSGADLTSVTELDPPVPAPPEEQFSDEAVGIIAPATTVGANAFGPETVVFLGGGEAPPEAEEGSLDALAAAETVMFRAWQGANVRVVAAESSGGGRSQVPQYNDLSIPSVDNADRPAGRAALVLLAAGAAADGAYGTKQTASDPFPRSRVSVPQGPSAPPNPRGGTGDQRRRPIVEDRRLRTGTASEGFTAVVAARNEGERLPATLDALLGLPNISRLVVADDGSLDATAALARFAGADVVSLTRPTGKGAALRAGILLARERRAPGGPGLSEQPLLLADADLGPSAAHLRALLEAADEDHPTTIATFPKGVAAGGGLGFVKTLSRRAIARRTGFAPLEPLSGQRVLLPRALDALAGLAPGFGTEVGMTLDLLCAGIRPLEVPLPLAHRAIGKTPRGFAHRARQGLDILRALRGDRIPL